MSQLSDLVVHTKVKLAALWASVMSCYIYCDYFELFVPGKLESIRQGRIGPLAVSQGALLGTAIMMAIPSLMIFMSVALPARHGRILNIVFGVLYTLLLAAIAATAQWYFYRFFAALEAALTGLAVWYAWKWPRVERDA